MMRYIGKRILQAIPAIIGVLIISFTIMHMAPGDPTVFLAGPEPPAGYVKELQEEYGFNRPVYEQLILYLWNVAQGDLGRSYSFHAPAVDVVLGRVPLTLSLMFSALTIAVIIGLFLGTEAARRPNTKLDAILQISSVSMYSIPPFWLSMVAIIIFSVNLRIFPAIGYKSVGVEVANPIIDIIWHSVLPVGILALGRMSRYARLTRASMLEILGQDYIVTARSRGCKERRVVYRHGLRNALLSITTMIGLDVRFMLMGTVLVEIVFGWPGLGSLLWEGLLSRDYNLLMVIFIFVTIITVASSIIVDVVYAFLDPRIRYGKKVKLD